MANSIDPHHNEFTAVKKVMIGLILLNLVTILFGAMTQGTGIGIGCVATGIGSQGYSSTPECQLNSLAASISKTTNTISTSFNNATTSPLMPTYNTSANYNGNISPLVNAIIIIPNVLVHVVIFIVSIVVLLGYMIYLIFFVLLSVIPAVFTTAGLGIFAPIFTIIYAFTLLIIVAYAIYIIMNRLQNTQLNVGL